MELVQKRVIELLQRLGLTEYEAEAYAILAFVGPMTAVEVAEYTKIPRPRVYDTLEKLVDCGCVKEGDGGEETYVAIPPSKLVEKIEAEEEERNGQIADTGSRLTEELEDAYLKAPREKELSYAVKGRANIGKQLLNMIEGAKRACVITSYAHSLVLKRLELRSKLEKLDELRIITTTEFEGITGSKVKKYPVREEFGMIIVDGKTTLIATVEGDSPEYNACVYIMDQRISDGLERAFDFVWRQI